MEFNRTATQFFHTAPLASARDAKLLHRHIGQESILSLGRILSV
jgi:hypothetical protein